MDAADFSLINMLDKRDLPLKNRINPDGYFDPSQDKDKTNIPLIPEEPLQQGEQYRFHFDMSQCIGCQCCVVACNEQNNNPATINWRRVGEIEGGTYPNTKKHHLSMACNHCLDPSCLTGCPTDAYVKLEDTGVVTHKAEECIGCSYCTWNCPYGVPQFNEDRGIVTKCDMCHNRLADGMQPACVAACPEGAIQIEKVNVEEWRKDHTQANAPHIPESEITLSTTRITPPRDLPQNSFKANYHHIKPEKSHASLIFMTVLTQLAAGGFFTLWFGDLMSGVLNILKPLQNFLVFGASGMLAVTGVALGASVFHLGRPLFAYKALRMWRRSWLSREVLLFSLFSLFGALYAGLLLSSHFLGTPFNQEMRILFGGVVSVLGLAGVYASAMIYLVPARPAWNTLRTPLRFFLSGFILGPLFALLVFSFFALTQPAEILSQNYKAPIFLWLIVSTTAAFFQLIVLISRLFYLFDQQTDEQKASSWLLIHHFRNQFLLRIGLLIVGNFFIPLTIVLILLSGKVSLLFFLSLSIISFIFSLCGELLGRYLFFVTVVPKNIPGGFFTQNGGSH